jgi:hypothetical protein
MRLIDADRLINEFHRETVEREGSNLWHISGIMAFIENEPTAFDVEAVVKELEEAKKVANEETFGRRNGKSILFGFIHGINLAIRVVRWNARFGSNPDLKEIVKWLCGTIRKGGVKND